MDVFIFIAALNMILVLIKIIAIEKPYEKVLVANLFASNVVIIVVMLSSFIESFAILDIAMIYIIINFIGLIAFLKFFMYKNNKC